MLAIYKREIKAYFYTPIAYVFLGAMFVFFGLFFLLTNILPRISMYGNQPATANFSPVLSSMMLVILFLLPILVMRLIAEERRQRTDQLLHTTPVSTLEIVFAKYVSAVSVYTLGLVISLIYPLIIYWIAKPDMAYLLSAYLGFFLLGASFIAICLFASAITENQIVAGFLGFLFILSMWLLEFVSGFTSSENARVLIDWFSLIKRFNDLQAGVIRLGPIVYYISVSFIFLFLTVRTIDKRRWTEG